MNIQQAAGHLQRQGLCIYPTETFFAIGCDACNSAAVDRLLKCKERPHTQGLPVIIGGREQLALACDLEPTEQFPTVIRDFAETLMERFWPGPLSLILPASKALAPGVGRGGSVALRWDAPSCGPSSLLVVEHPPGCQQRQPASRPSGNQGRKFEPRPSCCSGGRFRPASAALGRRPVYLGAPHPGCWGAPRPHAHTRRSRVASHFGAGRIPHLPPKNDQRFKNLNRMRVYAC